MGGRYGRWILTGVVAVCTLVGGCPSLRVTRSDGPPRLTIVGEEVVDFPRVSTFLSARHANGKPIHALGTHNLTIVEHRCVEIGGRRLEPRDIHVRAASQALGASGRMVPPANLFLVCGLQEKTGYPSSA